MRITLPLRLGVAAFAFAAAGAAPAAGGDRFLNGDSIYGEPVTGPVARTLDVRGLSYLNVPYGEAIRFVSGGREFAWRFNGLDHRRVDLQQLAPVGFIAQPLPIYIGPDLRYRN